MEKNTCVCKSTNKAFEICPESRSQSCNLYARPFVRFFFILLPLALNPRMVKRSILCLAFLWDWFFSATNPGLANNRQRASAHACGLYYKLHVRLFHPVPFPQPSN